MSNTFGKRKKRKKRISKNVVKKFNEKNKTIQNIFRSYFNKMNSIEVRKSPNDDRNYRNITLKNGLQVMLVSDPTTDKAAASLDVNVGHFADPENVPGIAHFLEHMLFLGTEDFPDENQYARVLQEHGGNSNAYTSCENTNYFFDVLQPHLGEVLQIFSAFFVNPLFTQNMTSRELKAVNSENAKNLLNDMWRSFQLQKSTADPDHPFSKFGTGNQVTLEKIPKEKNIDVRDVLLKFHEKWYSASIMKLCVLGRETLDELEAIVVPLFSRIRNNNVTKQIYRQGSPYTGENLPRRYNVVPVKDLRTIELGWPTHPLEHLYRKKPSGYCSHIIGHEGPGSLFALLKEEGLADALSAGKVLLINGILTFSFTF
jgi:insulysin